MEIDENNSENLEFDKKSWWQIFLLIAVLVIAALVLLIGFWKTQKDLNNYLKSKKEALAEILRNIEKAKKDREKLLRYKQIARFILRLILVGVLTSTNVLYVRRYFSVAENLPTIIGEIVDLNAVLLLVISVAIFLRYGNILELKNMFDILQNSILQWFFNKKEELIEAILKSNLESRESIEHEIEETEKAIKSNEELLTFPGKS